ncbi:MAG TPA: helix-turn-helix domain-containing protein [Terracidiphilus sp.]|nr:helix-turn-helix domain-containing protein [Terracidiphilus sp.]
MSSPVSIAAESAASNQPTWNGEPLQWHNGLALRWAWQQGPRLKVLGLGRREHLVLMSIAAHTDLEGRNQAFLSYATIAHETGLGRTSAVQAAHALKRTGLLSITEHPFGSNAYEIAPAILMRIPVQILNAQNLNVQNLNAQDLNGVVQNLNADSSESEPKEEPLTRALKKGEEEVDEPTVETSEQENGQTDHPAPASQPGQSTETLPASPAVPLPSPTRRTSIPALPPAPTRVTFGGGAAPASPAMTPAAGHPAPSSPAPALDAAARLAGQVADAQDGYATTLQAEMRTRLSDWFRSIAFPELGESRVRDAVLATLHDPEQCRAWRNIKYRRADISKPFRSYFLDLVQGLVDAHEAPAPTPATRPASYRPAAQPAAQPAAHPATSPARQQPDPQDFPAGIPLDIPLAVETYDRSVPETTGPAPGTVDDDAMTNWPDWNKPMYAIDPYTDV